jgi:hypothetical protein
MPLGKTLSDGFGFPWGTGHSEWPSFDKEPTYCPGTPWQVENGLFRNYTREKSINNRIFVTMWYERGKLQRIVSARLQPAAFEDAIEWHALDLWLETS